MNRVDSAFATARERGSGVLVPYVCPGVPTADALPTLLPLLERAGAGVIEVGFPYSDPIADGPVIAAAMHEALLAGMTPDRVLEQVSLARAGVSAALVAMVSVSIARAVGIHRFVGRCRDAGFDGFIFPDAPLEESDELVAAAREAGMTASLLVSPTTPPPRLERIAAACTGFVYMLARSGITGERRDAPEIADRARLVRGATSLPIACGFGISTAEHVRAVVAHADGAIVGSALVRRIQEAGAEGFARAAEAFVADLSAGLDAAAHRAGV